MRITRTAISPRFAMRIFDSTCGPRSAWMRPRILRVMPKPTASRRDFTIALAGTRFREVRWFASLDSTNRYLADEAIAGAAPGLVAVADEQTAGRGRLGRTWIAPPGASLLVSALLDGAARPRSGISWWSPRRSPRSTRSTRTAASGPA